MPRSFARVNSFNRESGTFDMTLATEGEASDGDILEIAGGSIPARMPLLISHTNDPTLQAGSITNPIKVAGSRRKPPQLTATGEIEMAGEGPSSEIRRDMALMIEKGHVNAVSIRWDPIESTRRVNLPSDHAYFVDADSEKDWRKRYGLYHSKWRALEGSVVSLGADPAALIRCADAADSDVAEAFWRQMAFEADRPTEGSVWTRSAAQDDTLAADDDDTVLAKILGVELLIAPAQRDSLQAAVDTLESEVLDKVNALLKGQREIQKRGPAPTKGGSGLAASASVFADLQRELTRSEDRMRTRMKNILDAATGKVSR